MKRKTLYIVAFLTIGLGVTAWIYNSIPELCANQIAQNVQSPNKQYQAVLFQRDCGATVAFSAQVSILDAGSALPNASGNVHIAAGTPWESGWSIRWQDNETLIVQSPTSPKTYRTNKSHRGIRIKYLTAP